MKERIKSLSPELAAAVLKQLRPVDLSLGIDLLTGSPLNPCPGPSELATPEARLFWLAAFIHYAQGQSHSGLSLAPGERLVDLFDAPGEDFPETGLTLTELLGDGAALCANFPEQVCRAEELGERPDACFVYREDCQLIFLQRWFRMERAVAGFVRERLARPPKVLPEDLDLTFRPYFPADELALNPWQAVTCFAALRHDFALITGGPGTGKTTTVARLLGLMMSLPEDARPRSVHLVAPTGKAAERLRESLSQNLERLPEASSEAVGTRSLLHPASTIHTFLGSRGAGGFRHHRGNPVSCDLLIVDESSMVDLELFLRLFDALPAHCRVVLMGDRNQLAAVGTGNVFTDLTTLFGAGGSSLNACSAGFREDFEKISGFRLPDQTAMSARWGDAVVELTHSYRFASDSLIGRFAQMLLEQGRLPGEGEQGLACLPLDEDWRKLVCAALAPYKAALQEGAGIGELLAAMDRVRILCAVRSGEHGVEAINQMLTAEVLGMGISGEQAVDGLPFMIRSNDRNLGLANGDCGVFRIDAAGELRAYLPASGAEPRALNPYALPPWEPAFALTIHKSQGSEYESVLVLLPEMKRKFITWELVYTAVTRAQREVSLIAPAALLGAELPRSLRRSGIVAELADR